MAKFTFPFTKRRNKDGDSFEDPKIPVTFMGENGQSFETLALLDTGSTISHLPLEIAEVLGFRKESARPTVTRGIGGEEKMAEFLVGMRLARKNQASKTIKLPVLVFLNPRIDYCILGLSPFFELFDVSFKMAEGKIELKER